MTGYAPVFYNSDQVVTIRPELKSTFLRLSPARREKLLDACTREFARKGYELASTNTIVRACGISKGIFFKYFGTKESIYLHLARRYLTELGRLQGPDRPFASRDILDRAEELFARHMAYARSHPFRYRFAVRALLDVHCPLHGSVVTLASVISRRTTPHLHGDVDWARYRHRRDEVVEMLGFLDLGIRQAAMQAVGAGTSIRVLERNIGARLALARKVLSTGLYEAPVPDGGR